MFKKALSAFLIHVQEGTVGIPSSCSGRRYFHYLLMFSNVLSAFLVHVQEDAVRAFPVHV
jgi:hypothetical protein